MPPQPHSSAARKPETSRSREQETPRPRERPRAVARRLPVSKVAWDKKFRIVMMVVLGLVAWIGLKAGLALMAARSQASQEVSLVSSLQSQHRRLVAQEQALHQPATIMRKARQLGMVRIGERSYVVVQASGN